MITLYLDTHIALAFQRDGVKLRCKKLLNLKLVELLDGEYTSTTVMLTKKDVLCNSTKKWMCEDTVLLIKRKSMINIQCQHLKS